MSTPAPERRRAERLPGNGAKVVLSTKAGVISGVLIDWSEGGALVKAIGEGLAGTRVFMRVQGPDKIWSRKAKVLWVSPDQSIGMEFESEDSAQKSPRVLSRVFQLIRRRSSGSTH